MVNKSNQLVSKTLLFAYFFLNYCPTTALIPNIFYISLVQIPEAECQSSPEPGIQLVQPHPGSGLKTVSRWSRRFLLQDKLLGFPLCVGHRVLLRLHHIHTRECLGAGRKTLKGTKKEPGVEHCKH